MSWNHTVPSWGEIVALASGLPDAENPRQVVASKVYHAVRQAAHGLWMGRVALSYSLRGDVDVFDAVDAIIQEWADHPGRLLDIMVNTYWSVLCADMDSWIARRGGE